MSCVSSMEERTSTVRMTFNSCVVNANERREIKQIRSVMIAVFDG
jgi:hypothetical protein